MTNKEFFRELKSKGVKIINSSKNNAATWMFLEKESFDPEAIFSQKTISRANYFLLDKKWLVSALEKFKEKMEAAVVAEEKEDVLLNFQRVYKNAFLNKKIKQVKMYLELLKTQMLETNEEQLKSRIKSQLLELRSEEFKTLENGKLKVFAKNNKNKKEVNELFEKTKDHIIFLEKRNIENIFYLSEQEPKELYKKIKEFINREEK